MAHRNGRTNAQLIAHLRYKLRATEYQCEQNRQWLNEQREENILLKGRNENMDNIITGLHNDLRGDVATIDDLRARLTRAEVDMQEQRESFNKAFRELEDFTNDKIDQMKLLDAKLRLAEKDLANALDARKAAERMDRERINQLIDVSHALAGNC